MKFIIKRIMVPLVIVFTALIGTSCKEPEQVDSERTAEFRVFEKTTNDMNQLDANYEFRFSGFGEEADHKKHKLKIISLEFHLNVSLSKEQCRILVLKCVQIFLENVNKDPDFPKYLADNPFTYKNIDFAIFLSNPDGSRIFDPEIAIVAVENGGVSYYINNPESTSYANPYKSIISEPYEEALEKAQTSKASKAQKLE